jgi:hypothetical protein
MLRGIAVKEPGGLTLAGADIARAVVAAIGERTWGRIRDLQVEL